MDVRSLLHKTQVIYQLSVLLYLHRVKATQPPSSENKDAKTSLNKVIMTPCKIFIQGVDATMYTTVIPGDKFEVSYV